MNHSILEKDENIPLPQVGILKASAGSGKTYSLTERFVQFLLSNKIPQNHLRNILAITFSNNAAKEMKERILSWLKEIHFGDPKKIDELSKILSLKKEHLPAKAGAVIEGILKNYTEFQVRTIDSFMTSIYKASAIDLGYSPDFEIVMAPERMMSYAFNRFLRRVKERTPEAQFIEKVLEIVLETRGGDSSYLWDPSKDLLEETVELYQKLSALVKEVSIIDAEKEIESIKKEIRDLAEGLNDSIERSGLPKSKGSSFYKILEDVRNSHFPDLMDKGLLNVPVLKPKKAGEIAWYETISRGWNLLGGKIRSYIDLYAATYYTPYLRTYEAFKDILEEVKKGEGRIFINDINKKLSDYLDHEIVPDIYFRIGDTIYHYLIDEFQDTSPIQWSNLFPLIENSLSQGGSFFAVGDTKQAIYGFRDADYGIMRGLESKNPFSSAHHSVKELGINYRSLEGIVDFSEGFFKRVVANHERYQEPARRSGLIDYDQRVKEDQKDSGYVEVIRCEKKEDEPVEKEKIQELIRELTQRGYAYSDIAILTYRNEDVVNVTTWLNEIGVPFISYSSLDIRKRKLTAEIVALLSFLDSPPDDLSFAGFIVGEIFREALERDGQALELKGLHEFLFRNRKNAPLYKAFQMEFPPLWGAYFEDLFKSAGYLPFYDLVSEIYCTYKVFDNFKEEEATLVKILEVIKNFEGEGRNNPKDFLRYTSDEETGELDWTIDVPAGIEAVKVMTIHKAKGLGFPVAILLIYEEAARGFKYILEEETGAVHLLKINRKIAESNNLLGRRYEEERIKDLVNKLNTLYVGFTRAEDELYVVGVQTRKYQFPIDLFQATGSPVGSRHGPRLRSFEPAQEMKPYHHPLPVRMPFSTVEELNFEERFRGEFMHRVLSFVDDVDEEVPSVLERKIQRANDELKTDYSVEETKKNLMEFLNHEELRPYFVKKPGRSIRREQDFSDDRGNLFRMDRVVIDEGNVSVIDYKTGDRKAEKEYISQLKNYMGILRPIYPDKNIEGVIAYVDLKEITLLR
jgi:ATP-dependent helicase/nuclease subunit A